MNWFHPIGGPVLLLPVHIARRWRGQHPEQGFSAAHAAVTAGLGQGHWVGLDVGGLALADDGAIGVVEGPGKLRLILRLTGNSDRIAGALGAAAQVKPRDKRIPWPGGQGVIFDAVENGDSLDAGFTSPLHIDLPPGPLQVHTGRVQENGLDLLVIELRPAS